MHQEPTKKTLQLYNALTIPKRQPQKATLKQYTVQWLVKHWPWECDDLHEYFRYTRTWCPIFTDFYLQAPYGGFALFRQTVALGVEGGRQTAREDKRNYGIYPLISRSYFSQYTTDH